MIRDRLKYLSVFFLCLAGIAFCAHLLMPHDHHSGDLYLNQESNCPASDNESGHSSGYPVHCNAFNDLASGELRHYLISKIIQHNLLTIHSFQDAFEFKLQNPSAKIPDLPKPVFDTFILESSLLRAPPSKI